MKKVLASLVAMTLLAGCDFGLRPDDPMRSKKIKYEQEVTKNQLLDASAKEAVSELQRRNPALFTSIVTPDVTRTYKQYVINTAYLEQNPEKSNRLGRAIAESLTEAFTFYGSARQVSLNPSVMTIATIEGKRYFHTSDKAAELGTRLGADAMIIPSYRIQDGQTIINLNIIRPGENQPIMQYAYAIKNDAEIERLAKEL